MTHCTKCTEGQGRQCTCPKPLDVVLIRWAIGGCIALWILLVLILLGVL